MFLVQSLFDYQFLLFCILFYFIIIIIFFIFIIILYYIFIIILYYIFIIILYFIFYFLSLLSSFFSSTSLPHPFSLSPPIPPLHHMSPRLSSIIFLFYFISHLFPFSSSTLLSSLWLAPYISQEGLPFFPTLSLLERYPQSAPPFLAPPASLHFLLT